MPQKVRIKLANGSLASQVCKVAQINVSRDINKFNEVYPLYFIVLSGPNNLLGRHSLQCLWPKEYEAFKNVCEPNVVSSHSGSLAIKIPNVGRPMKMSDENRLASNSVQLNVNSNDTTINASSSSLTNRKPVENSYKDIIKFVPNASDSNISDRVKTKELDKSLLPPI